MAQLQSPCLTPVCTTGQLPPEGLAALSDLGLTPALYAGITVAMDVVFAAAYTFVGVLIFWRRSDDRVAVFASLALLIFGTATFGFTMAALATQHPAFQGPVALLHFVGAAFFGLFLYTFPDGRFVPRWTRWVAGMWIGWQFDRTDLSRLGHRSGVDGRHLLSPWSGWPRWTPWSIPRSAVI